MKRKLRPDTILLTPRSADEEAGEEGNPWYRYLVKHMLVGRQIQAAIQSVPAGLGLIPESEKQIPISSKRGFNINKLGLICFCIVAVFLAGCSKSDPIQMVKSGTLKFDNSVLVGNAFDNYKFFSSTKWSSFEDSQKRTVVQFDAPYDLQKFAGAQVQGLEITSDIVQKAKSKLGDMKVAYRAQFTISSDGKTFELAYSAVRLSGKHKETGKQTEEDMTDTGQEELQCVYHNRPSLLVWGMLFAGG